MKIFKQSVVTNVCKLRCVIFAVFYCEPRGMISEKVKCMPYCISFNLLEQEEVNGDFTRKYVLIWKYDENAEGSV